MNQVVKQFIKLASKLPTDGIGAKESKALAASAIKKIKDLEGQQISHQHKAGKFLYQAIKTMGNALARLRFGGLTRKQVITIN